MSYELSRECHGKGLREYGDEEVIEVPAGIRDGEKLRLLKLVDK